MADPMDFDFAVNRRTLLSASAGGVGMLALKQLLAEEADRDGGTLAPRRPHHTPTAKSVILLFQNGGPSQMDLFDPKPELARQQGRPYPGQVEAHFDKQVRNLLASPFRFFPRGDCGMRLSEILPRLGAIADDITLVRSMTTASVDHEQALRVIHTGNPFAGKASWGSWVVYGLGTERDELPAYVVLTDPAGLPIDGTMNWSSGFLPAVYQGTQFQARGSAVLNLSTPADVGSVARRHQFELLRRLNAEHLKRQPQDAELQARISNYELAARMQTAVPDVLDINRETRHTRQLYGLDNETTADYGKRCLMARRLIEQGVRFVSIYLQSQPWDTHSKNAQSLRGLCARTDQPSAALVTDLKQRGLLDSTIVMFAGEFGRLPVSQGPDGRDHNRHGFSIWLAGGGFKQGYVHGATDDLGYQSVEEVVSVNDLHATLLHALGLDHRRLLYPHQGRDDSLTDEPVTGAEVVPALLTASAAG